MSAAIANQKYKIFRGIVTGAFIGGAVSNFILVRSGNIRLARSGVASISMLLCALFVFCAYFIANRLAAVLTISMGTFFASMGGPCAYTVTIDMGAVTQPSYLPP